VACAYIAAEPVDWCQAVRILDSVQALTQTVVTAHSPEELRDALRAQGLDEATITEVMQRAGTMIARLHARIFPGTTGET
jgi:SOS response regulatory protein OraA/RecX